MTDLRSCPLYKSRVDRIKRCIDFDAPPVVLSITCISLLKRIHGGKFRLILKLIGELVGEWWSDKKVRAHLAWWRWTGKNVNAEIDRKFSITPGDDSV